MEILIIYLSFLNFDQICTKVEQEIPSNKTRLYSLNICPIFSRKHLMGTSILTKLNMYRLLPNLERMLH